MSKVNKTRASLKGGLDHEKLYYMNLNEAAKKQPMHLSMRQNWVNTMILRVESAKNILESNGDLHPRAREALQQYEVLEVTSPTGITEKKLFTKPSPGVLWEVISLSETYHIVTRAHVSTGHGNVTAMQAWLAKKNLCVTPCCLQIIIDVCSLCQDNPKRSEDITPDVGEEIVQSACEKLAENEGLQETTTLTSSFEKFAQISDSGSNLPFPAPIPEYINMESKLQIPKLTKPEYPNAGLFAMKYSMESVKPSNRSKLKDLLIYQDVKTGFLQLRPVSGWDVIETISSELMNIFADMGPPSTLIVHSAMKTAMLKVIEKLEEIFDSTIMLAITEVQPPVIQTVDNALKEWISQKYLQSKWYLGCYHVQWTLNNTPSFDGKSAYDKMFAKKKQESRNKNIIVRSR